MTPEARQYERDLREFASWREVPPIDTFVAAARLLEAAECRLRSETLWTSYREGMSAAMLRDAERLRQFAMATCNHPDDFYAPPISASDCDEGLGRQASCDWCGYFWPHGYKRGDGSLYEGDE